MISARQVLSVVTVVVALAAPASAQPPDFLCNFLPFLPFCEDDDDDDECCTELQEIVDLHTSQIASLSANVAAGNVAHAELQAQVELQGADFDALEEQIQELIENGGFDCDLFEELAECDGVCVNTQIDEENCGDCGVTCEANQQCNDGVCELKTCPPPEGDPNFDCNTAILNADGTCTYTPAIDGVVCDDGLDCTTGDTCNNGTCLGGATACLAGQTCIEGSGTPPTCSDE